MSVLTRAEVSRASCPMKLGSSEGRAAPCYLRHFIRVTLEDQVV